MIATLRRSGLAICRDFGDEDIQSVSHTHLTLLSVKSARECTALEQNTSTIRTFFVDPGRNDAYHQLKAGRKPGAWQACIQCWSSTTTLLCATSSRCGSVRSATTHANRARLT